MPAQRLLRAFTLALTLLPTAALAQAAQEGKTEDVKAVASRVDSKYNRLQTLTADFIEIYSGLGINRQESGSLTLKRSGKMRWDFVSPKQKLFVSDGKTAYFYVPEERQVRKASVKKLDDLHSPIRYLLGRSKLNSEFKDLKLEAGSAPMRAGNVVLSGVPKHLADRVERVLLEISPESMIERIVIREIDGATTEFRFTNLTQNQAIADARFRFQPPAGVETIESAELMGR